MQLMKHTRIVIVGAGIGGAQTYIGLKPYIETHRLHITIIDPRNYFLFTPLLHEVATGALSYQHVTIPIRSLAHHQSVVVCQERATHINSKQNHIVTANRIIPYDYAVIASGAQTNFHGVPGAQTHAQGLKDINDAYQIRQSCIEAFERASRLPEEKRKHALAFVVIGAGSTGIEFVTELAVFIKYTLARQYRHINTDKHVSLTIIQRGSTIIPSFAPHVQKTTMDKLKKYGVRILLNTSVARLERGNVICKDGTSHLAEHIYWLAGVSPNSIPWDIDAPMNEKRHIIIDQALHVQGHAKIFSLGDCATCAQDPLPMLAQVTEQQGKAVAHNIICHINNRPPRPFRFHRMGYLVSAGHWHAGGDIMGIVLSGWWTWPLWKAIHWLKVPSWQNRVQLIANWITDMVSPRNTSIHTYHISQHHEKRKHR